MWSSRASGDGVSRRGDPSPEGLRYRLCVLCVVWMPVAHAFRPAVAAAQTPEPTVRVTFADAVRLAQERTPTVAAAAAAVLRAEGLERRGTGSRLNALRAQQQWSTNEGLLETSRLALYRAQEALGVLIAADGPADAIDEPDFSVPPASEDPAPGAQPYRADLRLFAAGQQR